MTVEGRHDTVSARLALIARRQADAVAIVEREDSVTYAALDAAATSIALEVGAVAQDRSGCVGVFFETRLPAIESIFGAARCGRAYVLLDAGDPAERLRFILQDSEPAVLLTEQSLLDRARSVAPPGCAIIDVGCVARGASVPPMPDVAPDAPVYRCYTSGSTGQPKGVVQTHRNLLFFADRYARAIAIGRADRLSLVYTLSFNAANMDIFGGLLHGAALHVYDVRRDGVRHLADWLDQHRITVLHAVPTVFRELAKRLPPGRSLPHLRAVDLGGEAVYGSDLELFRAHTADHCVFVNQLASTEVGLIAQHFIGHRDPALCGTIVPVGRCPDGVRVVIRRDDGSAAPPNEVGDIVVCSAHVSPGYWRRSDLDSRVFAADPDQPGSRQYISGDVGMIDKAGNLVFLGRRGSRVKIRGHTVDLMEIDAALSACPGVIKAAVLASGDEAQGIAMKVTGYVVSREAAYRDPALIRRFLATRLPSYMWPADFVFLDDLPLTSSGKVDRDALAAVGPAATAAAREFEPPQDEAEEQVAGIFERLLELRPIGRTDDFFLLGGDSLLGVELQSRLREAFGVHVANFHEDATVERIAANIRRVGTIPLPARPSLPVLVPLWPRGNAPALFLVHGRHGQAFVSPHFMRLLGDDQPVWAFQAHGLDGRSEPHSTVEAMAAHYLVELRRQQAHGPYFLGALCAGAYVASAVARVLRESSEIVLPLLLLDPPDRLLDDGYSQMTEEQFIAKMTARRAMGRTAGPVDDPRYMKSVVRVAMAFEKAISNHRPRPYDGPVYILSSRQRMNSADPAALRRIFTGKLKRFEVGTTHADALDPRNPVFAGHLLRCVRLIREAAQEASSPGERTAGVSVEWRYRM